MTGAGGLPYHCCMATDASASSAEGSDSSAAASGASPGWKNRREKHLSASSVDGVASLLPQQCLLWGAGGWWKYEWCPGKWVRQFHEAGDVVESEYLLGLGHSALVQDDGVSAAIKYSDGEYTFQSKLKDVAAVKATGDWAFGVEEQKDGPRRYFLSTEYTDGLKCEEADMVRTVDVRLHCADWTPDNTFTVTEVSKCRYRADVFVQSMCDFAPYLDVTATDGVSDVPAVEERIKELESAEHIPEVKRLVDTLNSVEGGCHIDRRGWWTYELCLDHWVRQVHVEDDTIVQEYFLGLGSRAAKPAMRLEGRADKYAHGKEKVSQRASKALSGATPAATGKWTVAKEGGLDDELLGTPGRYYFATRYTDGRMCDLVPRPREVQVRLYCAEGIWFNITETSTCRYVAMLGSPSVCRLKAMQTLTAYREEPPQQVSRLLCAATGAPAAEEAAVPDDQCGVDDLSLGGWDFEEEEGREGLVPLLLDVEEMMQLRDSEALTDDDKATGGEKGSGSDASDEEKQDD